MLTHSYHSTGVVARGALCYARSPLVEECVTTRHLGFTYDGNYDEFGKLLKSGILNKGLGWVIRAVGCLRSPWFGNFDKFADHS
jgi:hypothetical protein